MAEACCLFRRDRLGLKSAVEVHQLPHDIVFCAGVVHISTAPTTFLYCLYTCLSLDGKAMTLVIACDDPCHRFAIVFFVRYPQMTSVFAFIQTDARCVPTGFLLNVHLAVVHLQNPEPHQCLSGSHNSSTVHCEVLRNAIPAKWCPLSVPP